MEMLSVIARNVEEIWREYNENRSSSSSGCGYEVQIRDPIFNTRNADGSRTQGAWWDIVFTVTLWGHLPWWKHGRRKQVLRKLEFLKEMVDKSNSDVLSCNPVYGLLCHHEKVSTGAENFMIKLTIRCREQPVLPLRSNARPQDIIETYHRKDLVFA